MLYYVCKLRGQKKTEVRKMSNAVKIVNSGEVRKMSKKGVHLIIQGCGGDLKEWVDGIIC